MRAVDSGDANYAMNLSLTGEDLDELVDLINDALKDVQKKAAKKMLETGGGLTGLLGG